MADDIFDRRHNELREILINAAPALCEHTQSDALVIPITCTEPPIYVAVGDAAWLTKAGTMKGGPATMTEARARAILGETIQADGSLVPFRNKIDIEWMPGAATFYIHDGYGLSVETLEAAAWWMRNQGALT